MAKSVSNSRYLRMVPSSVHDLSFSILSESVLTNVCSSRIVLSA